MSDTELPGLLLGQQTPPATRYAPELLFPIPRAEGRTALEPCNRPMYGADVWHAYELSWLEAAGKPVAKIGRFTVPADSPNIIESKSFKLYLNSLNSHPFECREELQQTLAADLSTVAGAAVSIEICDLDDPEIAPETLEAICVDDEPVITTVPQSPDSALLRYDDSHQVSESLCSHLMRSLCPVTGQPDWASVRIRYQGNAIDRAGLLAYILGFRNHQEFHEQCVERLFCDLMNACAPDSLTVQAFYTRRGGLDINPLRSSEKDPLPGPRLLRQ